MTCYSRTPQCTIGHKHDDIGYKGHMGFVCERDHQLHADVLLQDWLKMAMLLNSVKFLGDVRVP